jgi:hypothetical protein
MVRESSLHKRSVITAEAKTAKAALREDVRRFKFKAAVQRSLFCGIRTDNIIEVSKSLENGADLTLKDKNGKIPLFNALLFGCVFKNLDIIRFLLDRGSDVNSVATDGYTPLHIACIYVEVGMAKLLLDYGADITAVNSNSQTPLDTLRRKRQAEKQSIYEYAQKCPAECWRRRQSMVLLHYSAPRSSALPSAKLLNNKDVFFHLVSFL